MILKSKKLNLACFFLAAFIISGCGPWGNFTTYFNLYYNTSLLFEQAEKTINEQKQDLFATTELTIPGSANQQLVKVIEKASKILQFHSQTAFIDDALLMLGKSFYYQKNYQKGLRKFQELIATQPESDLILETRLWIGRSEMQLRNYENALSVLSDVRTTASEEDEEEILIQSYIEEIKYQVISENYAAAISLSNNLLSVSDDDVINAEVVYQLGNLYKQTGDLENAIASYERVSDYSPSYETEFNTQVKLGQSLREINELRAALDVFESMRNEDKYVEQFAVVDLEIGKTLIQLDETDRALNQLVDVDTSYSSTKSAGEARFRIGEIYESKIMNFDSANVYYQKSATTPAPPEITLAAVDKAKKFKKYITLRQQISDNRQQLIYSLDSAAFAQDSINYFEKLAELQEQQLLDTENNKGSTDTEDRGRGRDIPVTNQNTQTNQSALQQLKQPIKPSISSDSLEALIVKSYFELGNLFFTEMNLLDSAKHYYNIILEDYPNSNYQARTMFALGSYYESTGKNNTSDSLYSIIYDRFKEESIVNAAANKLNKPLIEIDFDPAKDLYKKAEEKLLQEEYSSSANEFYEIFKEHPSSTLAPKALYASGWILENELKMYDSAVTVYDSILVKYPQTTFASTVRPKIQYYKQEKERIKIAKEDSLKALEQQQPDSLKVITPDSLNQSNKNEKILTPNTSTGVDTLPTAPGDSIKTIQEDMLSPDINIRSDSLPVPKDSLFDNNLKDTIETRHDVIIDSLRRSRDNESLQKRVDETLDSTKVKKP